MLNQVLYSDQVVIQDAESVWTPYALSPQPHLLAFTVLPLTWDAPLCSPS